MLHGRELSRRETTAQFGFVPPLAMFEVEG